MGTPAPRRAVVEGVAVDRDGLELVGDEDIQGAVVVEIGKGDPPGVRLGRPAELRSHVDELEIAGVALAEVDAVRLPAEDAVAAQVPPPVGVRVDLRPGAH